MYKRIICNAWKASGEKKTLLIVFIKAHSVLKENESFLCSFNDGRFEQLYPSKDFECVHYKYTELY